MAAPAGELKWRRGEASKAAAAALASARCSIMAKATWRGISRGGKRRKQRTISIIYQLRSAAQWRNGV
jgi:hypothetical protein